MPVIPIAISLHHPPPNDTPTSGTFIDLIHNLPDVIESTRLSPVQSISPTEDVVQGPFEMNLWEKVFIPSLQNVIRDGDDDDHEDGFVWGLPPWFVTPLGQWGRVSKKELQKLPITEPMIKWIETTFAKHTLRASDSPINNNIPKYPFRPEEESAKQWKKNIFAWETTKRLYFSTPLSKSENKDISIPPCTLYALVVA